MKKLSLNYEIMVQITHNAGYGVNLYKGSKRYRTPNHEVISKPQPYDFLNLVRKDFLV